MSLYEMFVRENVDLVMYWLSQTNNGNDLRRTTLVPLEGRNISLVELRPRSLWRRNSNNNSVPEWMNETFPPPASWRSHNHRYSVGDITESGSTSRSSRGRIISIPSTRSLKFHPLI